MRRLDARLFFNSLNRPTDEAGDLARANATAIAMSW
jgi:hypothetical protein